MRHDIWDYVHRSAPSLVDIERDGADCAGPFVQATKQGFLFVLDRAPASLCSTLRSVRRHRARPEGRSPLRPQPFAMTPRPRRQST